LTYPTKFDTIDRQQKRVTVARKAQTQEEKVAKKLIETVNDLTLDLEEVGEIIGSTYRNVSINRLVVVAESAEYTKENRLK
jgi:hypothetical protein